MTNYSCLLSSIRENDTCITFTSLGKLSEMAHFSISFMMNYYVNLKCKGLFYFQHCINA